MSAPRKGQRAAGQPWLARKVRHNDDGMGDRLAAAAAAEGVGYSVALMVLTVRCQDADERGDNYTSQMTLADDLRLSRKHVKACDRALEAAGLMERTGERGPRGTVVYRLVPEVMGRPVAAVAPPAVAELMAEEWVADARVAVEEYAATATQRRSLLRRLDGTVRWLAEEYGPAREAGQPWPTRGIEHARKVAAEVVAEARCPAGDPLLTLACSCGKHGAGADAQVAPDVAPDVAPGGATTRRDKVERQDAPEGLRPSSASRHGRASASATSPPVDDGPTPGPRSVADEAAWQRLVVWLEDSQVPAWWPSLNGRTTVVAQRLASLLVGAGHAGVPAEWQPSPQERTAGDVDEWLSRVAALAESGSEAA